MRIGFYQFCPSFHDPELNLGRIAAALGRVRADLVVLPEMCTTGYLFSSREEMLRCAEPVPDGPSCRAMVELCRKLNVAVVFGLAEKAGDRLYNSAVLVTGSGEIGVYRKAHLFYDEKDVFEPGDLPFPVFDIGGVKVGHSRRNHYWHLQV